VDARVAGVGARLCNPLPPPSPALRAPMGHLECPGTEAAADRRRHGAWNRSWRSAWNSGSTALIPRVAWKQGLGDAWNLNSTGKFHSGALGVESAVECSVEVRFHGTDSTGCVETRRGGSVESEFHG
jgi:hypothetical protein